MDHIIALLQEEIAAAQRKFSDLTSQRCYSYGEERELSGYIKGLNTALFLLTRKETVSSLDY